MDRWVGEYERMNQISEPVSVNEWVSERMREWVNESINKWTNEWTDEWIDEWTHQLMHQWVNESTKQRTSQWMSESSKERGNERTNGWVSYWFVELLLHWTTSLLRYLFSQQYTSSLWPVALPPSLSYLCCGFYSPILLFTQLQSRMVDERHYAETRWSPRTRMLTRMLMVQMSKHMVMQSRTIPFCNSLFEQSCACFACYQSAVWSGKCRVWSVECEVRSVECKVWSGECRVCKV